MSTSHGKETHRYILYIGQKKIILILYNDGKIMEKRGPPPAGKNINLPKLFISRNSCKEQLEYMKISTKRFSVQYFVLKAPKVEIIHCPCLGELLNT